MSWKNANLFRLKSLSLVTKLMLFYSLSTLGLLAATGLFLYPTFAKIMAQLNGSTASNITAECYQKIIVTLLFSSLIAIVFGHLIARKGLNRMRDLEAKMEQITAESLHERIDLNDWPKELKRFAEKFNTMLDRIQTSFIQLSQFSSDIAHELRTPINNLRGTTELALSKENLPTETHVLLESHMEEYQHLSKLIENLLFLARSDHGQLTIRKELIQVRERIIDICDYYQAVADEHSIAIVCMGDAKIIADPTLFKRVISNLLSNALRYTNANGKIEINIESTDDLVHISILDTGTGIGQEHLSRVFDRFYRADSSRSLTSGNLGLGLAIVKSIIDLHRGKISIASQEDHGTSVNIELPAFQCSHTQLTTNRLCER